MTSILEGNPLLFQQICNLTRTFFRITRQKKCISQFLPPRVRAPSLPCHFCNTRKGKTMTHRYCFETGAVPTTPHFLDMDKDSSSAMLLSIVRNNSLSILPVSMFSFFQRKRKPLIPDSSRPRARHSAVFLENRLMDFTRIRSTLPMRQACKRSCSPGRISAFVPVMPASQKDTGGFPLCMQFDPLRIMFFFCVPRLSIWSSCSVETRQ